MSQQLIGMQWVAMQKSPVPEEILFFPLSVTPE